MSDPGPVVTVIGPGRAGLGLALALRRAGYRLAGVVGRRRLPAAAARLAGRGGRADLAAAVERARIVLICVPDAAIGRVVAALDAHAGRRLLDGRVVLHVSGALTDAPLAPLRRQGAAVGCFHPLFSFPPAGEAGGDLRGVAFAVDGDPGAVRAARAMTRALGGRLLRVPPERRTAYHLAASLLANHLVALLEAGLDLAARRLAITPAAARDAFLPLVLSAVENVRRAGPGRALTGPIARGDVATVRAHLEALAGEPGELGAIYRLLGRHALSMARARGDLDGQTALALARILGCD